MPDALLRPILDMLSVMSLELRASVQMAEHQNADARRLFAQAEQEEKRLGYREPPMFIRPVAEIEGAALLAGGDWVKAKAAFQRALLERPRSGFALYGIAMASEKAGATTETVKEYTEFLAVWKSADPDLEQVIHARRYLAEQEGERSLAADF